ncbi:MAG TPA: membrane protein insertase YidC, partial [Chitinophagaceae bacterium]
MNFDRNTIIGFIVLAVLFIAYFFYTSNQQQSYLREKALKDSIANLNKPNQNAQSPVAQPMQTDTTGNVQAGQSNDTVNVVEKITEIETDLVKIAFTSKGGQPKWVELKQFKSTDSNNVKLASTDFDQLNYRVNTSANQTRDIHFLNFNTGEIKKAADGSQTITYQIQTASGGTITHEFVIKPDDYMIDFNLHINGVTKLLNNNTLNLTWQAKAVQLQKDLKYEKQMSDISYYTDGDYDYTSAAGSDKETFDKSVKWVAVKQQFFNTAFLAKNDFNSGSIEWISPTDGNTIVEAQANLKLQLSAGNTANIPLAFYYGP